MIQDVSETWLEFKVFDHDGIGRDDFLGSARLK